LKLDGLIIALDRDKETLLLVGFSVYALPIFGRFLVFSSNLELLSFIDIW